MAACAYGTLECVKSLHRAFQNTKDPVLKMLNIATLCNCPEIAEYCIGLGARVDTRGLYNLHHQIMLGNSYETCKVLVDKDLDINYPIEYFGDILMCAVDDDNLDWVRFCLKNFADPNLNLAFNQHSILANAAEFASLEICELLIEWRADIKGSNALTVASHMGRADLVILLLHKSADVDEMGVANIDDNLENIEETVLHLIHKGREDILHILLNHGADVNKKDCIGKMVLSRVYASGDKILTSVVIKNGGRWR